MLENKNPNQPITEKPESKTKKPRAPKSETAITTRRKKIDKLIAVRENNEVAITKLEGEIKNLEDANKNINNDILTLQSEISSLMLGTKDTQTFAKVVDGLSALGQNPMDILKLFVEKDFDKLQNLMVGEKGLE